ncbi:MAG TPA: hypothetical protein VID29_08540 [Solirubrobacteraceae bacterium]
MSGPALAPDTAMVLGIASTAMPFARTREAAAERWLRILRGNGEVGEALRALGVSEGRLADAGGSVDLDQAGGADGEDRDAVARVTAHAVRLARERDGVGVTTVDVLIAVMRVYGSDFDRVLRAHGTSRDAVIECLGWARRQGEVAGWHMRAPAG